MINRINRVILKSHFNSYKRTHPHTYTLTNIHSNLVPFAKIIKHNFCDKKIPTNPENNSDTNHTNSNLKSNINKIAYETENTQYTENINTDNFFYDKSNIEKNIISLDQNNPTSPTSTNRSNFQQKMNLEEESSQPLIENEAYRELYRNFSLYTNEEESKSLDIIYHNEEINGKEYKYGLLAKNQLPFTDLIPHEEEDELPKTPNENLNSLLEIDKETSFESLLLKIQLEYNHGKFY